MSINNKTATAEAPVVSAYRGQAASKQLVADLIAASGTASKSGLGPASAALNAFNSVITFARKFKKKADYKSLVFQICNNTTHPIIIEAFSVENVAAITEIPPVIISGENASIQTFDAQTRDNKYYLTGRIGDGYGPNYRFKMTFINYKVEYSNNNQPSDQGYLGLDKFELFWGSTTDDLSPIATKTIDRNGISNGQEYVGENSYISCKYDTTPSINFGVATPLISYYGEELYIVFYSI